MPGIVVRYRYEGDEATWQAVADAFVQAINDDPDLSGKFHYTVTKAQDGVTRTHFGRWDSAETLATLQSRDYFSTFTRAVKELAGESLEDTRVNIAASTV